jgi:hypothetical protein
MIDRWRTSTKHYQNKIDYYDKEQVRQLISFLDKFSSKNEMTLILIEYLIITSNVHCHATNNLVNIYSSCRRYSLEQQERN